MITSLKKNEIFVFGSNLSGWHSGGAALQAKRKFGAEEGIGEGLTGQCYAFPTLGTNMTKLSEERLIRSVKNFFAIAWCNPDKKFLMTKVGCGIAGYSESYMKSLFTKVDIPDNVVLPRGWE